MLCFLNSYFPNTLLFQQNESWPVDNSILILVISFSIIMLVILCAALYITTKKRALNLLFDEFTENQEEWIKNRVTVGIQYLVNQNEELLKLSSQLLCLDKETSQTSIDKTEIDLSNVIESARLEVESILTERRINFLVEVSNHQKVIADALTLKVVLVQLFTEALRHNTAELNLTTVTDRGKKSLQLHLTLNQGSNERAKDKNSNGTYPSASSMTFCQMAIAAIGGTIEAATPPDKGATFHLDLAAVIDEPPPQSGSLMQHAS